MTSRRPLVVVLSLLFPAMIVIFAACSDEAEGERCDTRNTRNGSDDCQPGLVCVPGGDLGSAGSQYCISSGTGTGLVATCGVCCPVNRANATVSVCQLSSALPGADAAPPDTDAGDAATDASDASDAAADASDASDTDADAASADASDADASDASDASDDGG